MLFAVSNAQLFMLEFEEEYPIPRQQDVLGRLLQARCERVGIYVPDIAKEILGNVPAEIFMDELDEGLHQLLISMQEVASSRSLPGLVWVHREEDMLHIHTGQLVQPKGEVIESYICPMRQ